MKVNFRKLGYFSALLGRAVNRQNVRRPDYSLWGSSAGVVQSNPANHALEPTADNAFGLCLAIWLLTRLGGGGSVVRSAGRA